jgi:hypothetical protein
MTNHTTTLPEITIAGPEPLDDPLHVRQVARVVDTEGPT